MPADQDILLKCRVYNGYDLDTETETITIPALSGGSRKSIEDTVSEEAGAAGQRAGGTASAEESVSGQETGGMDMPAPEEETVEASGNAHQIDMKWYEEKDAEKEKDEVFITGSDVSRFLWLVILGLLVAVLVVLVIARAKFKKQQKKARYRGRRR